MHIHSSTFSMHLPIKYFCNASTLKNSVMHLHSSTYSMNLPIKYFCNASPVKYICNASTNQVILQCMLFLSIFAFHLPLGKSLPLHLFRQKVFRYFYNASFVYISLQGTFHLGESFTITFAIHSLFMQNSDMHLLFWCKSISTFNCSASSVRAKVY